MSTKDIIAEQVLYRLYGGTPDSNSPVEKRDIYKAMEQMINSDLKLQHFAQTLPSGETLPENLMIGIYDDVAVTSSENVVGKSYATLPAMPISLPKNLGIYQIYDTNHPDSPFIPIQAGMRGLLKTDALLSDLLGQVSFEPKGKTVFFSKDLPLFGIASVTMELLVMDMSQYGANDVLPIPADMEATLVERLYMIFSAVQPETAYVNPYSTITQNPPMTNSQRKV